MRGIYDRFANSHILFLEISANCHHFDTLPAGETKLSSTSGQRAVCAARNVFLPLLSDLLSSSLPPGHDGRTGGKQNRAYNIGWNFTVSCNWYMVIDSAFLSRLRGRPNIYGDPENSCLWVATGFSTIVRGIHRSGSIVIGANKFLRSRCENDSPFKSVLLLLITADKRVASHLSLQSFVSGICWDNPTPFSIFSSCSAALPTIASPFQLHWSEQNQTDRNRRRATASFFGLCSVPVVLSDTFCILYEPSSCLRSKYFTYYLQEIVKRT